ncbi:MAG: hypothetical protein BRD55_07290 [Bacteroidetes bacterium SW_9_63_38]|nr:MAG: hypothetical protein BRD55_07290 [Bacteroidetes bacterium SW_9_63_38]
MSPIDTLQASKRLQEEGVFSPEQAERIAEILSSLDVASATKDDLEELEARMEQRFDQVDERFEQVDRRFEQIDERFEQIEERFDQVDRRFEQIDERFGQVDRRFEQMDERLTQRIELSEERTEKQISQLQSNLYRVLLIGFGALSTLIIILNYVTG